MTTEADPALVQSLMQGAIDLHCHSGPSVMARAVNHEQALEQAAEAGMRAVLFKDHYYPTGPFVDVLKESGKATRAEPVGSIVLNNAVGGINPFAVEPALKCGAKVVWMPTVSAANHIREGHRKSLLPTKSKMLKQVGLSAVDARGELLDNVKQVLDIIAEHDAVLSCGHLHISEVWPLFDEAKKRGVTRLLVNHPSYTVGATLSDVKELVSMGAWIEHSICMFIPNRMKVYDEDFLKALIEAAGVDRTFFGSDLGQTNAPLPVEGFRQIIGLCLSLGYSEDDIRKMVGTNAAQLAGIGANQG
ncbi:DUF6282 family protein [Roseomonas marmotae]|uniref:Cytosolic protein n=1 Tax=Roseomonas marmotae TaxID=2768161 RepID=A0ABS3KAR5_9PROT|nr:DUF6282 family protein [Roseomonas marmotae]MBO1074535.1 hypothetical protein [Roseomonas marmotae]QTI81568.1 hypothetical protein IAI58_19740 [Roseomonas marmotae]